VNRDARSGESGCGRHRHPTTVWQKNGAEARENETILFIAPIKFGAVWTG
jgi:hypothetical protein